MLKAIGRIACIAAAGLMLGGCGGCGLVGMPVFSRTVTSSVPQLAGKSLTVTTNNGGIEVSKGGMETVEITAKLRGPDEARLKQVVIVSERADDGGLHLGVSWPGGKAQSNEGCSFAIVIPDAIGLTLTTDNGGITEGGFTGMAVLTTSNGGIHVKGHDGSVRAHTSNGSVNLKDVLGPVEAQSSNGSVTVHLMPLGTGPVSVQTSNGSVSLEVGAAFQGELRLGTSNGGLTIQTPSSVTRTGESKTSATLKFPGQGSSSLKTSNGNVTVKQGGAPTKGEPG